MASPDRGLSGARVIAQTLHSLKIDVVFGIVGIPVVDIAEECLKLGVRFLGFRNEQAASYAAGAYGYLSGRPGVCLVVGGPGVLHAMAGIGNSNVNAFPFLLLAGSSESHLVGKGAFQELDAVALLTSETKLATRPSTIEVLPSLIRDAYRIAWSGRPGPTFVDLPADCIQGTAEEVQEVEEVFPPAPIGADPSQIRKAVSLLKSAKAPLVVIGKGAAYAKSEVSLRQFIDKTGLPFLPTPMGKGVISDSHAQNCASARSTALKHADIVLVLGARLNWILHFGEPPKWNASATFIQVDISPEEIGRNTGSSKYGIIGDIQIVINHLSQAIGDWTFDSANSNYIAEIERTKLKNEARAKKNAAVKQIPLTYAHAFSIIKQTIDELSPPEDGNVVYVAEGANTMDISRSAFAVEKPRLRLDAGTHATMGIGLGYAIAAHAAYNTSSKGSGISASRPKHKKVIALEGDSAFGFSAMEVETMARYGMDILIFVINNGGIYHGDSDSGDEWLKLQEQSREGKAGLRSTSLGWEVGYEKIADACGGVGYLARDDEQLRTATSKGFKSSVPVVVNVIIEAGTSSTLEFGWQASAKQKTSKL